MPERKHDLSIEINATPDLVWEAVSTAEGITKWFAPDARITPGENGKFWLSWGAGMEGESRIVGWEPGHRWTSLEGEGTARAKTVDYIVETNEGRTTFRVVHSGFGEGADFDSEYESTHAGWRTFLAILKYGLERFPRVPAQNVTICRMLNEGVPTAWPKLLDGLSLKRDGDRFTANLDGLPLQGSVVSNVKEGYLTLSVDTLGGAIIGLFVEGCGPGCFFTVMNILFGDTMSQAGEVRAKWTALADRLFTAPQIAAS